MCKSGLTTLLVSDCGGLSATRAVRGADLGPSERPGPLLYHPSRPSRASRGTRSGRWSGPACRGACALASDAARAAAGWPKPVGNATVELPPGFRMPPVCHWSCRWRTPLQVNSKPNGFAVRRMRALMALVRRRRRATRERDPPNSAGVTLPTPGGAPTRAVSDVTVAMPALCSSVG
jgi:hypothetical protein